MTSVFKECNSHFFSAGILTVVAKVINGTGVLLVNLLFDIALSSV